MTAGGTLIVNSATPFALGSGTVTWTPGAGTVQLSQTNTLLYSAGVFSSFNNLTISGNTTTLGGNTTLTGALVATGTLNTSTFTLGVAGNFTVNGAVSGTGAISLTGAGTTIDGTGSVTNTTTLTISTGAKSVLSTANLSFANTIAVSGAITVTNNGTITTTAAGGITGSIAGSTWTNAANSTLNILGPLLATGTLDAEANPNTINYSGAGQTVKLPNGTTPNTYYHLSLSGSGTVTMPGTALSILGNFTTSGTESTTAAAALTVGGNFTMGTGTTFNASSFTHNVAGNFSNSGTFTASTGAFNFNGAAASQTITGATTFNDLTVANTFPSGSLSLAATSNVTVGNNLTLTSGTFAVGANTLTLNGPTIAGTATNLSTTSSSNLSFGGNSAGINLPSSVTSLNNLTLNNTNATPQLTLNGSPTVAGILTLTSGVIVAGTNTLTTSANCPGSIIRTAGWVSGNLRMAFPAGTPNCTFHVGDATVNYTPMQVNFTAATPAGNLTASVTSQDHRNTTAGITGIDPTKSVNRFWTLANSTLAGTYTARFTYIAGDNDGAGFANYRLRRGAACAGTGVSRTCTPWGSLTISGIPTNTITDASGIAISADGPAEADFSIGEADPSTNFQREKQFIYTRELY